MWAMVQWQDALGDWHDVDGWRGLAEANGRQIWWVAKVDRGTGPFRWQVYEAADQRLMGISAPFYLPAQAGGNLVIEVVLTP